MQGFGPSRCATGTTLSVAAPAPPKRQAAYRCRAMMCRLWGTYAAEMSDRGAVVDLNFSAVTRPVERLMATAQNGFEVLRWGGLETGVVPSPFQTVESTPRCTSCGGTSRRTAARPTPAGPPVLMVHPMMMSANMWDVTQEDGAVGILHAAGVDPWVIDFGSPTRSRAAWNAP